QYFYFYFFFQAEDGIRDRTVTGVQTCALPICQRLHILRKARATVANPRVEVGRTDPLVQAHALRHELGVGVHTLADPRDLVDERSEERRVGKECRCRWGEEPVKQKRQMTMRTH